MKRNYKKLLYILVDMLRFSRFVLAMLNTRYLVNSGQGLEEEKETALKMLYCDR